MAFTSKKNLNGKAKITFTMPDGRPVIVYLEPSTFTDRDGIVYSQEKITIDAPRDVKFNLKKD